MKLLKIDNSSGLFLGEDGKYETVDKLSKDGLLYLVDRGSEEKRKDSKGTS